uniref:Uncharacterized protein n=1 Tax=Arundo donax TaxID=35708 RepID=A0A0A8ZRL8_ARUDO
MLLLDTTRNFQVQPRTSGLEKIKKSRVLSSEMVRNFRVNLELPLIIKRS